MHYKKIVLLAGEWDTTPIVFNFLQEHFGLLKTIIENPVARNVFLKRRIKKLGIVKVAGQVLFQLVVVKPLASASKGRIQEILKEYRLDAKPIDPSFIKPVSSVNDAQCLALLLELDPDCVMVHGTRIISKKILQQVKCPFINIHAGITPRYRGVHGAYWALANNDKDNCGVTVHLVDEGIDTGNILFQQRINPTEKDNFVTYPYLQLAEGLYKLKEVVQEAVDGKFRLVKNNLDSALWYHPTLWGYLLKRITKGVK